MYVFIIMLILLYFTTDIAIFYHLIPALACTGIGDLRLDVMVLPVSNIGSAQIYLLCNAKATIDSRFLAKYSSH